MKQHRLLFAAFIILAAGCNGQSSDVESSTSTAGATSSSAPIAEPGGAGSPVELVAFSDYLYGVAGVAPDGWTPAEYGILLRGDSAIDATVLVQQAAPGATEAEILSSLVAQLELSGPPPAGLSGSS